VIHTENINGLLGACNVANIDLHDTFSVGTDAPQIAFRVLKRYLSSGPPDIHHYYRRHRAESIQHINTVDYRVIIPKSVLQLIALIVREMENKSPRANHLI